MRAFSRPIRALYAGSFDPPSNGHLDIIQRAVGSLCDTLTVAVAVNPAKKCIFTLDERVALLRKATQGLGNVSVDHFGGLVVDYAKRRDINLLVRGLRAYSDFEVEFRMALINRKLTGIETAFLMADEQHQHVSSTMIRELAHFGRTVPGFVPESIQAEVYERFGVPLPGQDSGEGQ